MSQVILNVVKNLLKFLCSKFWFYVFLLVILSACKNKKESTYEDYDEEDFRMVPGIVIKITRTPIMSPRPPGWHEINVYYAYNLDSDTVLVGKEMDVDMAVNEGEGIYVLVHKEDELISFPAGIRIMTKDEVVIKNYLKKSKKYGVKYYGINEQ